MESEETAILERAETENMLDQEDEVIRHLDRVAEVLGHFAENVNRISAQARILGMDHDSRRALYLYASLSGALAYFNRDRKGT